MHDTLPFDPTALKSLSKPGPRKPLSKWQFATLFLQQQGKCARCSVKLEQGETIDEHLQPLDHLGTNDVTNRALYCRPCAKAKTARDLAASAKGKRIRRETCQGPKRRIAQPANFKWPTRKLQSRNDLRRAALREEQS